MEFGAIPVMLRPTDPSINFLNGTYAHLVVIAYFVTGACDAVSVPAPPSCFAFPACLQMISSMRLCLSFPQLFPLQQVYNLSWVIADVHWRGYPGPVLNNWAELEDFLHSVNTPEYVPYCLSIFSQI